MKSHSPRAVDATAAGSPRVSAIAAAIVYSATAWVGPSGTVATAIPRRCAAPRSMCVEPAVRVITSRTPGRASRTASVTWVYV